MYAILNDRKFIRARFFLDPNEVFEFSVSDEPKYYKTRTEAERVLGLVEAKIAKSTKFYTEQIAKESAKADKSAKEIIRLQGRLEELYEQPFKDVERKVAQVRKQIESAEWYVKSNSVKSWGRDLARLARISKAGLRVVKIQQTVELA